MVGEKEVWGFENARLCITTALSQGLGARGGGGKGLLLCKGQRDMNLIRYYIHMDNAESIFTKPHTFIYLSKKKKKKFPILIQESLIFKKFYLFIYFF